MKIDKSYWDTRYIEATTGWDIGYPSPPIIDFAKSLHKETKILIPGAGNAYEGLWLAEHGYTNVHILDISEYPLEQIRKKDAESKLHLHWGDFFEHQGDYDVILEQTFFCALDPSMRSSYVSKMNELLISRKGSLAGVLFATHFQKQGPPFGGDANEYRDLFSKLFTIEIMAPCYNSIPSRAGNEIFFKLKAK